MILRNVAVQSEEMAARIVPYYAKGFGCGKNKPRAASHPERDGGIAADRRMSLILALCPPKAMSGPGLQFAG
jgi:hypothetical protein